MSRITDPALLQRVREQPCTACGATPSDPDHVTTRGAGGGDLEDNLLPLCRRHHTERHKIGWSGMFNRYARILEWMIRHGRQDVIDRATRFETWSKKRG